MNSFYVEFIKRFNKDARFKDCKLSCTEHRKKSYKDGKELEVKILRVVVQINIKNSLFLKTISFRINYILEENSTEVVTNSGYIKKKYKDLDYGKISLFIYESIKDLKRKDLSIIEVL